ncbi:initiation factor 4F subunit [Perilla frutescens var. hirtella]|uniref:Initiation factor 4F subunit n=1 Tax=Perilla frutescens var. hirtella TaxID=608512 RepID=A0AAD4ISD8_PERFH|nr:initiation factor 4F subunit [Perilla frutescens var. hirtella]
MVAAILACNNFPKLKLYSSSQNDPSHFITHTSRFRGKLELCSLPRMTITGSISNSQFGRVSDSSGSFGHRNGKIYRRLGSCLVIPPTKGRKPKALVKFLGGAFIGAVPEVTYSYLLGLLAEEGYLIISVPYNVTFDHEQVTREIYERFHACLDSILSAGLPEIGILAAEVAELPFYSVGHSNGALLQVLSGSYFCEKIPKANAIISYNNRPASEAVPYFEQLGPLVKQMMPAIETLPMYSMAQSFSVDGWRTLMDIAERVLPDYDPEATVSLTKFVDQLPSVFNQVAQGTSEFKPAPAENLDCFKKLYSIQQTLLVKFEFDTIDETDLLEETLKPRVESFGGKLEKVVLRGTHITPCIQEPSWQVGAVYTPADAIAQGLKAISLNEIRVLARTISNWFDCLE